MAATTTALHCCPNRKKVYTSSKWQRQRNLMVPQLTSLSLYVFGLCGYYSFKINIHILAHNCHCGLKQNIVVIFH